MSSLVVMSQTSASYYKCVNDFWGLSIYSA